MNPNVQLIDTITDIDGMPLTLGTDYGTVTVAGRRLDADQREQFERAYAAACQAADAYEEPE